MNRWYAVHTHARAEEKALLNLIKQGYTAYLPRYRKFRRHARRFERVLAPLFPRYLFVRMDVDRQRWRPIQSTFGVRHLVGHGNRPTSVPEAVIEEIKGGEDDSGLVAMARQAIFKKGAPVRVSAGPMADLLGIFECASDEQRVFILLELLGRQVRVRLPVEMVTAEP